MNTINDSDRSNLIRLASSLPEGSPEKRAILNGLKMAAGEIWPERCKKGTSYRVSYRGRSPSLCMFRGWKLDSDGPVMSFVEVPEMVEWEAYMFHGEMCVGSSADKIVIEPA